MNKMMQDSMHGTKAQDRRLMDRKVEMWFKRHFGHVAQDDPLYPALVNAKNEVKRLVGAV